eukprot:CFRG3204T1
MKFAACAVGALTLTTGVVDAWSIGELLHKFEEWSLGEHHPFHHPSEHHPTPVVEGVSAGTNWAVLVAGSEGYFNYRHQADVCHAYQILRSNGYPAERIILMMKDDIANNIRNPFPGTLINQPGGDDVYKGCIADYTGSDVTPENFFKVLTGEATGAGNGKTLKSGPNDHVFINFVDHGGVGLIAFPRGKIVTSRQLYNTLEKMKDKKMYKKMVFYMEACEAGSMFDNLLPEDWNIFATTASTGHQSSYATYWDMQRRTFLGDLYSVSWLEDSDKHFFIDHMKTPETLETQYKHVYARTCKSSQPQQYGDVEYANRIPIEEYQQFQEESRMPDFAKSRRSATLLAASNSKTFADNQVLAELDAVSSRDVTAQTLERMMADPTNDVHKAAFGDIETELQNEYSSIQRAEDRFVSLAWILAGDKSKTYLKTYVQNGIDHDCLSESILGFQKHCHVLDEYHIRFTRVLAHLCHDGYTAGQIQQAMVKVPSCQY